MNLNPRLHPGRAVLALGLLLLLGIGACSVPSSYEVEVGQQMAVQFSKEFDGPTPEIAALLADVDAQPGVEDVMVNERITENGTRLDLRIMGREIDAEALIAELSARHPVLADAEIAMLPIEQTVEGPLYERLGHEVFGWEFAIEVDGDTPEEIEAQIREQLEAEGFDGEANVDVLMDEEAGTVEINLDLQDDGGDQ